MRFEFRHLALVLESVARAGARTDDLLAFAGLERDAASTPAVVGSFERIETLLAEAARRTKIPSFGVETARRRGARAHRSRGRARRSCLEQARPQRPALLSARVIASPSRSATCSIACTPRPPTGPPRWPKQGGWPPSRPKVRRMLKSWSLACGRRSTRRGPTTIACASTYLARSTPRHPRLIGRRSRPTHGSTATSRRSKTSPATPPTSRSVWPRPKRR